jgi:hypothetical protein
MNAIRMATPQKSQCLAVFGWKLTAPFIRLLRWTALFGRRAYVAVRPLLSRQIALAEVKKDEAFYRAIPYRPSYNSPFHEEKLLTAAALDVAASISNFLVLFTTMECSNQSMTGRRKIC